MSTTGPITHFQLQGRYIAATNAPIAAGPTPARRNCAAKATLVNPSGIPPVTYSRKKSANRFRRVDSRSNMAVSRFDG